MGGGDPSLPPAPPAWTSEPLVPVGDLRPRGERTRGKPWEEAIQAESSGNSSRVQWPSPAGLYSVQYPRPLLSLLSVGKAPHLPGTPVSPVEPDQHGGYDNMFWGLKLPGSKSQLAYLCFLIVCSWVEKFIHLSLNFFICKMEIITVPTSVVFAMNN